MIQSGIRQFLVGAVTGAVTMSMFSVFTVCVDNLWIGVGAGIHAVHIF